MKILFLGGVFSKEMEEDILEKSKGTVHYAANKLQWNLIDGFINLKDVEIEVISAPFIGTYPKDYKDLFFKKYNYSYKDVQCNYVSFCNLWGYRSISRKGSLIREIKGFILDRATKKTIIVYSPHTPFLQAAVYAKQKDPSIHICLIVPDLPQFMNLNEKVSSIYTKLKSIDIKLFEENAKYIDSFVLLTKHMADVLKVGDRPQLIVEGVVNSSLSGKVETNYAPTKANKTVVYTGTLNKKFGVINLIKAFHAIEDPSASLKICGRGDSEDFIKDYQQKDSRIHFLGQISNDEAVKLQKEATVLVNPRQNNEEFTKYSFPSKNMEYLLTGNPVIVYKLDGIPDEYDDYFFYVEDNSIESLTNKISHVLKLTDQARYDIGKRAREFVLKTKNNNEASAKIINMIKTNQE